MSPKNLNADILLKFSNKHPFFFFDFDGTLSEIVPTPEEAGLTPAARMAIVELHRRGPVGIISGRRLADLRSIVGIRGLVYSGNHGVEIEGGGMKFIEPNSARSSRYIVSLAGKIASRLRKYHARVNSKKYSVSIHYRTLEKSLVKPLLSELNSMIAGAVSEGRIYVFHGKKVVEIKSPVDWDKGKAIRLILKTLSPRSTPIFFGDDTTDEYGFREVNKMGGISVFVGRASAVTAAKYRVTSPAALVRNLQGYLEMQDMASKAKNLVWARRKM